MNSGGFNNTSQLIQVSCTIHVDVHQNRQFVYITNKIWSKLKKKKRTGSINLFSDLILNFELSLSKKSAVLLLRSLVCRSRLQPNEEIKPAILTSTTVGEVQHLFWTEEVFDVDISYHAASINGTKSEMNVPQLGCLKVHFKSRIKYRL